MSDSVNDLQDRSNALDGQLERLDLLQSIRAKESVLGLSTMQEAYPEVLSAAEIRNETGWGDQGYNLTSKPDDYIDGHYRPFYQSQQEHQDIRGLGRSLAGSSELASCILSNLRNYTIGQGSTVSVSPKEGSDQGLCNEVQAFIDEFLDANDLIDSGESELFLSGVTDGDTLLALHGHGKGVPHVRFVGGEHILEPRDPREIEDYIGEVGLSWTYGIATYPNDPTQPVGYFVDWYGKGGEEWDFIPSDECVFYKRNTPRAVKRGVSDFFVPFHTMDRGKKLFDNAVLGAAIQASIAGIKKAPSGVRQADLDQNLASRLSSTGRARSADGASSSVNYERYKGGKMLTISNMDFMYGPMGTPQGATYLDSIYQAVARLVGTRWCMPEYMISGDASNNNYASSLVSESPFVKQVFREQATLARTMSRLIWRALAMSTKDSTLSGMTVADIYRHCLIDVEYPSPESRNELEQENVFDRQQAAGILSAKTRAVKSELDYDMELKNGAKPQAVTGIDPTQHAAVSEALEHLSSTEEARAILEAMR